MPGWWCRGLSELGTRVEDGSLFHGRGLESRDLEICLLRDYGALHVGVSGIGVPSVRHLTVLTA